MRCSHCTHGTWVTCSESRGSIISVLCFCWGWREWGCEESLTGVCKKKSSEPILHSLLGSLRNKGTKFSKKLRNKWLLILSVAGSLCFPWLISSIRTCSSPPWHREKIHTTATPWLCLLSHGRISLHQWSGTGKLVFFRHHIKHHQTGIETEQ